MNIDEFIDSALKISGLNTKKARDEYTKKIDVLESRLKDNFDELDFDFDELQFLHMWLWSKNQNRFPSEFSESDVKEYSSISDIIEKDFNNSNESVGICVGLASEYIILAERLGRRVKPIHLRGISDSHVYLKSGSNGSSIFINPIVMTGYNCDVTPDARKKSRIISKEELLGLLLNNDSVANAYEKNYEAALTKLKKAKLFYSDAPEIIFNEARINFKTKNIEKSEAILSKLPSYCIDDPKVMFLKGEIEYEKENYKDAANLFRDVALCKSEQAQKAIRYIGTSLDKMGHSSEAIHYLKQALDLNPEDGSTRKEFYRVMRKP